MRVDPAAVHEVFVGVAAVAVEQRGPLIDAKLDLVAHLGLVGQQRETGQGCILAARPRLYFSTGSHARGSTWIVLTPHAWASSRVSKTLASVL